MNDEVDIANDLVQHMIDMGVTNAKTKAKITPNTSGKCIWCEDPVKDERRWCSIECRNEYQKHYK